MSFLELAEQPTPFSFSTMQVKYSKEGQRPQVIVKRRLEYLHLIFWFSRVNLPVLSQYGVSAHQNRTIINFFEEQTKHRNDKAIKRQRNNHTVIRSIRGNKMSVIHQFYQKTKFAFLENYQESKFLFFLETLRKFTSIFNRK